MKARNKYVIGKLRSERHAFKDVAATLRDHNRTNGQKYDFPKNVSEYQATHSCNAEALSTFPSSVIVSQSPRRDQYGVTDRVFVVAFPSNMQVDDNPACGGVLYGKIQGILRTVCTKDYLGVATVLFEIVDFSCLQRNIGECPLTISYFPGKSRLVRPMCPQRK